MFCFCIILQKRSHDKWTGLSLWLGVHGNLCCHDNSISWRQVMVVSQMYVGLQQTGV